MVNRSRFSPFLGQIDDMAEILASNWPLSHPGPFEAEKFSASERINSAGRVGWSLPDPLPISARYYINFIRELLRPTITAEMRSFTCSFLNSRRI